MSLRCPVTRPGAVLALCLLTFAFVACAPTHVRHKADHEETKKSVSVLLMPVDVELSALTAGGVSEIRADWTHTAKGLISDALRQKLAKFDDRLVEYTEPQNLQRMQQHAQLFKLHREVGQTIMIYSAVPGAVPPTKKGLFEWSLGEEVRDLHESSGAEYGLFIHIRDSYATAGRAVLIVTSALLGVNMRGGTQAGFATLVDLRDGSVVWFNRIINQTGDLRTKGPAYSTVEELIEGIPL